MVEIAVAIIGAVALVLAAWIPLRERRQDRDLALEATNAKNAELEALRARLADCQETTQWLRSQLSKEATG